MMTSYAQMSRDEFQGVLDGCESIMDVTTILRDLGNFHVSTATLHQAKTMSELRSAQEEANKALRHLRVLNNMCSERMIALAQQHKY